jgi:hypothetical protein
MRKVVFALVLSGCSFMSTPTPEVVYVEVTSTPVPATDTPVPTNTPLPTNTLIPTDTTVTTPTDGICDIELDDFENAFDVDLLPSNEFTEFDYIVEDQVNPNFSMLITVGLDDNNCVQNAGLGGFFTNDASDAVKEYLFTGMIWMMQNLDPTNETEGKDFILSSMESCSAGTQEWSKDFIGSQWDFICGLSLDERYYNLEIFTGQETNS